MQANRRTDTGPERGLRSALHRLGLRFRKDLRLDLGDRYARPDIVFPRARVAVFVDGCFWHSCPQHGQIPRANREYWEPKLARNVERDRENDRALAEAGWTALRFYEHEDAATTAKIVQAEVRRRRNGSDGTRTRDLRRDRPAL
jgi:DNA mismatch endonuclease, patch repair protein